MSLDFDSARLSNPYLTADHEEWRNQLRRFFDREIMPFAADWDEAGKIPDELWPKAAKVGMLGLGYPEVYGGISEDVCSSDLYYPYPNGAQYRSAAGGKFRQRRNQATGGTRGTRR